MRWGVRSSEHDDKLGVVLGVECEYGVWRDGRQVDFRDVLDRVVGLWPEPLWPAGHGRFWCPDGHVLMADGWYAEIASPPEPLSPDAPLRIARDASEACCRLSGVLEELSLREGVRYRLSGYSTHLNISSDHMVGESGLAKRIAVTYGPLLLFVLATRGSAGVLVRPRGGRVELASDFVGEPERLRAGLTLLVGAFLAAMHNQRAPTRLRARALVPSDIRSGWRLQPVAVSSSLWERGRLAEVRTVRRGVMTLQSLFELNWRAIGPQILGRLNPAEVQLALEFVRGERHSGVELASPAVTLTRPIESGEHGTGVSDFGVALSRRRAGAWNVEPVLVDWGFAVMSATRGQDRLYLTLPRKELATLRDVGADQSLARAFDEFDESVRWRQADMRMSSVGQATTPAIFSDLDLPKLAAEVERTRKTPAKRPRLPAGGGRDVPWMWIGVGLLVVLALVGAAAFALLGGGGSSTTRANPIAGTTGASSDTTHTAPNSSLRQQLVVINGQPATATSNGLCPDQSNDLTIFVKYQITPVQPFAGKTANLAVTGVSAGTYNAPIGADGTFTFTIPHGCGPGHIGDSQYSIPTVDGKAVDNTLVKAP